MRQHHPRQQRAKQQHGFALLEVLIAVVVLSIGLLGMAALQSSALRNNQSSLERSQAVIQSYFILDAIRATAAQARLSAIDFPAKRVASDASAAAYNRVLTDSIPSGGTVTANDQRAWLLALQANLNNSAQGQIRCAAGVCTITIRWDDSRGTAGSAVQDITITGQI
ncbi:MAG: type IV pilus modification protein PilV [Halothiobacillaceae bacterium]|nr:type IV pilus modification protein PilV [Halothiobacillaceae bacterium]